MAPSLLRGDFIVVQKNAFQQKNPDRDDVVVFRHPREPRTVLMNRVIAVSGDWVFIKDRKIFINDREVKIKHPVIFDSKNFVSERFGPLLVPPAHLFVMGDNRDVSDDSRFFGYLPKENVIGKPKRVLWSSEWSRLLKKL